MYFLAHILLQQEIQVDVYPQAQLVTINLQPVTPTSSNSVISSNPTCTEANGTLTVIFLQEQV